MTAFGEVQAGVCSPSGGLSRGRFDGRGTIGFMRQDRIVRRRRSFAMSGGTFATLFLAALIVLAVDFSASISLAQHGPFLRRQRIGRIFVPPPSLPVPFIRRGIPLLPYDYYSQRGVAPGGHKLLGSNEIVSSLQAKGFRDISPPQNRGSTYITEATGPRGERVRLIINGQSGGIDGVRAIGFEDRR
jgi:hypothetical protein